MLESRGSATSHISQKILKYVNCTYESIAGPSQKNNFMIHACIITGRINPIERERYTKKNNKSKNHGRCQQGISSGVATR